VSTAIAKVTSASCFRTVWSLLLGIVLQHLTMLTVAITSMLHVRDSRNPATAGFHDTAVRGSISMIDSAVLASPPT